MKDMITLKPVADALVDLADKLALAHKPARQYCQPPIENDHLTLTQAKVLRFIFDTTRERGLPPSIREIGIAFQISSPNGVVCHLQALVRKGYLEISGRSAKAIRIRGVSWVPVYEHGEVGQRLIRALADALGKTPG